MKPTPTGQFPSLQFLTGFSPTRLTRIASPHLMMVPPQVNGYQLKEPIHPALLGQTGQPLNAHAIRLAGGREDQKDQIGFKLSEADDAVGESTSEVVRKCEVSGPIIKKHEDLWRAFSAKYWEAGHRLEDFTELFGYSLERIQNLLLAEKTLPEDLRKKMIYMFGLKISLPKQRLLESVKQVSDHVVLILEEWGVGKTELARMLGVRDRGISDVSKFSSIQIETIIIIAEALGFYRIQTMQGLHSDPFLQIKRPQPFDQTTMKIIMLRAGILGMNASSLGEDLKSLSNDPVIQGLERHITSKMFTGFYPSVGDLHSSLVKKKSKERGFHLSDKAKDVQEYNESLQRMDMDSFRIRLIAIGKLLGVPLVTPSDLVGTREGDTTQTIGDIHDKLKKILKRRRTKCLWSYKAVAEAASVPPEFVKRVERGKLEPKDEEDLRKVLAVFKVHLKPLKQAKVIVDDGKRVLILKDFLAGLSARGIALKHGFVSKEGDKPTSKEMRDGEIDMRSYMDNLGGDDSIIRRISSITLLQRYFAGEIDAYVVAYKVIIDDTLTPKRYKTDLRTWYKKRVSYRTLKDKEEEKIARLQLELKEAIEDLESVTPKERSQLSRFDKF